MKGKMCKLRAFHFWKVIISGYFSHKQKLPVDIETEMEAKGLVDERWDPLAARPTTEIQHNPATIGARARSERSPTAGTLPDPVTPQAICRSLSTSFKP
jgi:hypothetical protein